MADFSASDRLVILLHGRGGVAADLAWLETAIPHPWDCVRLQAPLPSGAGFEWFHVRDPEGVGPLSRDVAPAADRVTEWAERHAPHATVGLVGYSQGGAVAVHALRRHPGRFAFAVAFAGFTTIDGESADADLASRRPPVLWARGTDDDVIPSSDINRMLQFLPRHVALDERVYPGVGHAVTGAMAADLTAFIDAHSAAAE